MRARVSVCHACHAPVFGTIRLPVTSTPSTRIVPPEIRAGTDTVVLGCTHYHFLAGDIRALYPNTTVVDTSEAVARRAVQVLEERGERAGERHQGGLDIIISGDRGAFEAAMRKIQFETTQVEARR